MDPDSLSALMITVFLLGAAPGRTAAENCQCSCSDLPQIPQAEPPPAENCCTGGGFRYTCVDGYLRKAGTSNLAKCTENAGRPKWEHVEPRNKKFECIPDPRRPPPKSTAAPPSESPSESPKVTTTAYPELVINATRQQQKTTSISRESLTTAVPTSQPTQSAATSAATPSNLTNQTHSESSAAPTVQSEAGRTTSRPAVMAAPENSTSAENSTSEGRRNPGSSTTVPAGLSIVGVLLVICAATGIAVFLRKRRSRRPDRRTEELTEEQKVPMSPMENAPSEVC